MYAQRFFDHFGSLRKKGVAIDTNLQPFTMTQILVPAAPSATAVRAAITLTTAVQTITSGITNPDVPRAVSVTGSAGTVAGVVLIKGRDADGVDREDRITLAGTATVAGIVPFAEIFSVTVPVKVGATETITVGTSSKLGFERRPTGNAVVRLTVDGTAEAAAAVSAVNGTFTPTTAPNGTRVFQVFYKTKWL